MSETPASQSVSRGILKSPLDFGGGLFLIGLAIVGFFGGFSLPFGQLSGIGSGLMPKTVAVLVAAFGVLLIVQSLFMRGDRLEAWAIRGPIFVLGGVLVFAATIRPLGAGRRRTAGGHRLRPCRQGLAARRARRSPPSR